MDNKQTAIIQNEQISIGRERFTDSLKRITHEVFGQRNFKYSDHSLSESIGYGRHETRPDNLRIGYMTGDNNRVYMTFRAAGREENFAQMMAALQNNPRIHIVTQSLNTKVQAIILDQCDTPALSQALTAFKEYVVEPGMS